jgi:hypothetical protein
LIGLTNGFVERITENEQLPAELRTTVATAASEQGLEVIPVVQVEQFLTDAGLPPDQVDAIAADYGAAQLDGLRLALGGVALLALLGLFFTRNLPDRATEEPAVGEQPVAVAAPAG